MMPDTDYAALRAALGLSQQAAAKMAGVTVDTWSNWERGKFKPGAIAHRKAVARMMRKAAKMEEAK